MAVHTDPVDFVSIYGLDGIGRLVGIRDNTTDVNGRKNAANEAYVELAGLIKGYWRNREFDYTSSSTPALTAVTRAYNVPTTSGAVFDTVHRLYYRSSGTFQDVPILGNSEWLERSATRSTDTGYPDYARIIQTSSATRIELNRPLNQAFIDSIGTLTLEYFIAIAQLVNDTDTTVLPRNLALQIIPYGAWIYAFTQSDWLLVDRLEKRKEEARAFVLKHDLTRTGRPRQLRPKYSYTGQRGRVVSRDYGMLPS